MILYCVMLCFGVLCLMLGYSSILLCTDFVLYCSYHADTLKEWILHRVMLYILHIGKQKTIYIYICTNAYIWYCPPTSRHFHPYFVVKGYHIHVIIYIHTHICKRMQITVVRSPSRCHLHERHCDEQFFSLRSCWAHTEYPYVFIFPAMMSSHIAAIGQKSDTNFTSSLEDWKVVTGVTNRCCVLMTDAYHVKDLEQHATNPRCCWVMAAF